MPHHMMAMADPSENYSVARYVEEATACVEDIFARGKQPILVGGTGLYIDALCKGQTFSDFQPDSGLRAKLQAQAAQGGLPQLWADLERIDPEAAARLHPNDEKRILPGAGGVVHHRQDHLPAQPGDPGHAAAV